MTMHDEVSNALLPVSQIELRSGFASSIRVTDANGSRSVPIAAGMMYFVNVISPGGGLSCLWNGRSYETALEVATEICLELDVELVNLVRGGKV